MGIAASLGVVKGDACKVTPVAPSSSVGGACIAHVLDNLKTGGSEEGLRAEVLALVDAYALVEAILSTRLASNHEHVEEYTCTSQFVV
jgi:hypothetical protein